MAIGALIGGSGTGLFAAATVWTAGQPFWLALAVYALVGAVATVVLAVVACGAQAPRGSHAARARG